MFRSKYTTQIFFDEKPVFTTGEFAIAFPGKGKRTNQSLLDYHVAAGNILRVRRALYASIPLSSNVEKFVVDPLLIASKITEDSVVSYHSALRYYGLAHSARRIVTFTTKSRNIKSFEFQNSLFQPVLTSKALVDASLENLLVSQVNYQGGVLKVSTQERTFVDCVERLDLVGGVEELIRSSEEFFVLQIDEVARYALALKNATTIAKTGFFTDFINIKTHSYDSLLELQNHLPHSPVYLFRKQRHGKLVKKWNLIVPEWVLERRWEEGH